MLRKSLLLSASASAIAITGASVAHAQVGAMTTRGYTSDDTVRTRAETAELYASSLSRIMETIEKDVAEDTGTTVIDGLRLGQLTSLPSLDSDTRALIENLGISAIVVDTDDDPNIEDERVIVYVANQELRGGISRTDIEAAAASKGYRPLMRIQDGEVVDRDGSFALPEDASDVPQATIGAYTGISGLDKLTSGTAGSAETRVVACEAGYYGTGIVQVRDNTRSTNLGGDATESYSGWTEVSRSCAPEYVEPIRYFDSCGPGDDGVLGTSDDSEALYVANQYVRKSSDDPFETEIFLDRDNASLVDDAECMSGDRISGTADFLVEGHTDAEREIELRTNTSSSDIGNGVNTIPAEVNSDTGAVTPVAGIPFPASSMSDVQFLRTCAQEYGAMALPDDYRGPDYFSGTVEYYRDYNRRETYFSDTEDEYVLNYDLVEDANIWGWPAKDRGRIQTNFASAPDGDQWYKYTEDCERTLEHDEIEERTLQCSSGYPGYPNGTYDERRDGIGTYLQTTPFNTAPDGPTLISIAWDDWYETSNGCYYQEVVRTDESRTVTTTTGGQQCDQDQVRTKVVTTNYYYTGSTSSTTTYDPNWTNDGAAENCVTVSSGGSDGNGSYDVDGDGQGDYSSYGEATNAGYSDVDAVGGGCGSCNGPSGSSSSGSDGGGGGGGGCFDPATLVTMADGTFKTIADIEIGDEVAEGGVVLILGSFLSQDMYHLDGVRVTGEHVVRSEDGWCRVKDHPRAVAELPRYQKTCNLITSNNRMVCGGKLFADQTEFGGVFLDDMMALGADDRIAAMNAEEMEMARRVA